MVALIVPAIMDQRVSVIIQLATIGKKDSEAFRDKGRLKNHAHSQ